LALFFAAALLVNHQISASFSLGWDRKLINIFSKRSDLDGNAGKEFPGQISLASINGWMKMMLVGDVMTDNEASTDNCSQRKLNFYDTSSC